MNNIISKYIRKKAILLMPLAYTLLPVGMTSCSDYLEIKPLNQVVLEDYWTKKSDVTSALNGCYESLGAEQSLRRLALWGELRSENLTTSSNTDYTIAEIVKESILPTQNLAVWSDVYQTVNRCNTVIHYAPEVAAKDPNYTPSELKSNIAEATFLRDLCLFYLTRTFRDIPMPLEPSIDNTKDYAIAATPMAEVLEFIAQDLDKVKDDAVKRFIDDSGMSNSQAAVRAPENTYRVTRVAIYALLAEVYLWQQKYDEAIKCCEYVIDFKKQQYKDKKEYPISPTPDVTDLFLFHDDIPLIREALAGTKTYGMAYNAIFGDGFSFESLFELGFKEGPTNKFVFPGYVNTNGAIGQLSTMIDFTKNVSNGNSYFDSDDCRVFESIDWSGTQPKIIKYAASEVSIGEDPANTKTRKLTAYTIYGQQNVTRANWIFYRLTDVMLMKAEALILKENPDYQEAFNLIDAVNRRARNYCETTGEKPLKFSNYSGSKELMEDLLLEERRREFMFEGKRWFDLVRKSLRDGNSKYLQGKVTQKQQTNAVAIRTKLADMNYLFLPYNRDELKRNDKLKQNPAYSDSENYVK